MWATGRLELQNVGYAGVLAVNVIGSASVIVPVPGLAVVCGAGAGEVGLNPALLGLAGGFGSTVGEMSGYLAGYGGNPLIQRSRHYERFRQLVIRNGGMALFVLSVIPNPVFDIAGIAAGSLGVSAKAVPSLCVGGEGDQVHSRGLRVPAGYRLDNQVDVNSRPMSVLCPRDSRHRPGANTRD